MLGDAAVPTPPTLRDLAGRLTRATIKDPQLLTELGRQLRGVRERMGSTSDRLLGCLDAAAALLSSLAHLDDQAAHEVRAMTARLLGLVYDEAAAEEAATRVAEEAASRATEAANRAAEIRAEATRAAAARSGTTDGAPRAEKSARPGRPIGAVSKPGLQTIHDVALGDVMVQLGLIEPYHVEAALREVARSGRRFGGALVELGVCSWDEVQQGLKAQAKMAKAAAAAEASPAALPSREGPEKPQPDAIQSILLGEVLVQMGKINRQQLAQGLAFHQKRRVRLGAALVALGAISWPDVTAAMQAQERLRKEATARS